MRVHLKVLASASQESASICHAVSGETHCRRGEEERKTHLSGSETLERIKRP